MIFFPPRPEVLFLDLGCAESFPGDVRKRSTLGSLVHFNLPPRPDFPLSSSRTKFERLALLFLSGVVFLPYITPFQIPLSVCPHGKRNHAHTFPLSLVRTFIPYTFTPLVFSMRVAIRLTPFFFSEDIP